MDIYQLLNKMNIENEYRLKSYWFNRENRETLETEKDRKEYDLIKRISTIKTEINQGRISYKSSEILDINSSSDVRSITDEDIQLLREINLSDIPACIRISIADLIWETRKDWKCAKIAAQTYYDVFCSVSQTINRLDIINLIDRAITISKQINNNSLVERSFDIISSQVEAFANQEDKAFTCIELIDVLNRHSYKKINEFLPILDTIIERDHENPNRVEKASETKEDIFDALKDNESKTKEIIARADYYKSLADEKSRESAPEIMRAVSYYEKSIALYQKANQNDKVVDVQKILIETQKIIPQIIHPWKRTIDVSELIELLDSNFAGLSFEESVIRFTQLIPLLKKSEIEDSMRDSLEKYPLSHAFPQTLINEYGQKTAAIPSFNGNEADANLDIYINQRILEDGSFIGETCVKHILKLIRERFNPTKEMLRFIVERNAIIPLGREGIFLSTIDMAFKGMYYEAIHIMAPQFENMFRVIAKEAGAVTIWINDDCLAEEKTIGKIFDLQELKDCYDNDELFLFKALLNEKTGANIRNEIAHGLVNESRASHGIYLYFIGVVIKILVRSSQKCTAIYTDSEKLLIIKQPVKVSFIKEEEPRIHIED